MRADRRLHMKLPSLNRGAVHGYHRDNCRAREPRFAEYSRSVEMTTDVRIASAHNSSEMPMELLTAATKVRCVAVCVLGMLALQGCVSLNSVVDSGGEAKGPSGSS